MIDIGVLRASGLTDAQILKVLETEQSERQAKVREQNRIRQRNQRSRNAVTRDVRDVRDAVHTQESLLPTQRFRRQKESVCLPDDFECDLQYAIKRGWPAAKAESEAERFRLHAKATGRHAEGG